MHTSNPEDILILKMRKFDPGFAWAQDSDKNLRLVRLTPEAGRRQPVSISESKRATQDAVRGFRRIGEQLESGAALNDVLPSIASFASRYGTLYGDTPIGGQPALGTVHDWVRESLRFLDVCEASEGIRKERIAETVVGRIIEDASTGNVILKRRAGLSTGLATPHERYLEMDEMGHKQEVRFLERARSTNSRRRCEMAFIVMVAHQLREAVNLSLHPLRLSRAEVTPHGLLATLYARLWIDTAANVKTRRRCRNPKCGKPLPEDAHGSQKYCLNDGKCQKAGRRLELASAKTH